MFSILHTQNSSSSSCHFRRQTYSKTCLFVSQNPWCQNPNVVTCYYSGLVICCTTIRCMQEIAEWLDTVPLHTGFFTMAWEQGRSSPFLQGYLGCNILSLLVTYEKFYQFFPDSSFCLISWWIHIFCWNIPHLANLSSAPCRVKAQ